MTALRHRLLAEHLDCTPEDYAAAEKKHGSMVDAIEALTGPGKSLELLTMEKLSDAEEFIASNELLDPESPDAMLDPIDKRGLGKSWAKGQAAIGRQIGSAVSAERHRSRQRAARTDWGAAAGAPPLRQPDADRPADRDVAVVLAVRVERGAGGVGGLGLFALVRAGRVRDAIGRAASITISSIATSTARWSARGSAPWRMTGCRWARPGR